MSLKLNIGLSRKIGEPNYGSRGASINVESEVDSAALDEPTRLKDRIRQLFTLVRASLDEELHGSPGQNGHHLEANGHQTNGDHGGGPANGNGTHNGGPRPATQSQVKALYAITKSQGLDLTEILRERFRIGRADHLSIREASQLIDELKSAHANEGR